MKTALICALSLIAGVTFAVDEVRIDINGQKDQISLSGKSQTGMKTTSAGWLKEKAKQCLVCYQPMKDNEWTPIEFTFVPDKNGTVDISLAGGWAAKAEDRNFIIYDDVTIDGIPLKNGGFEEKDAKGKAKGWWCGSKAELVSDAKSGDNAAKVNHDYRFVQRVNVEAGKTYTLKANVKKAQK